MIDDQLMLDLIPTAATSATVAEVRSNGNGRRRPADLSDLDLAHEAKVLAEEEAAEPWELPKLCECEGEKATFDDDGLGRRCLSCGRTA